MENDTNRSPLLEIENLTVTFADGDEIVTATKDVSLTIYPGERVALVGESGSGKSVTSRCALRMEYPGKITQGSLVRLDGVDVTAIRKERDLRPFRGAVVAMVFQDPETALVPIYRIGSQIVEALREHHHRISLRKMLFTIVHLLDKAVDETMRSPKGLSRTVKQLFRSVMETVEQRRMPGKEEMHKRAVELLRDVRLDKPEEAAAKFPMELSGGQQQRALIAMMLAGEPKLLIADEATTALDVRIQAEVLELISDIVEKRDMALLFITHDLSVVAGLCDRVLVMYAGRIVEEGLRDEIFAHPSHPYTKALLEAVPRMDVPNQKSFRAIPGDPPQAHEDIDGCPFRLRGCVYEEDVCAQDMPIIRKVGEGQRSACHFAETLLQIREVDDGC